MTSPAEQWSTWHATQPPTAFVAAQKAHGQGVQIQITRYRLDGTRCGLAQGRHAAWNWAFILHIPGAPHGGKINMGRGLENARANAAIFGDLVVERWPGGSAWRRGPRGGLAFCSLEHEIEHPIKKVVDT